MRLESAASKIKRSLWVAKTYQTNPHMDPLVGQEPMQRRALVGEHVRIPFRLLHLPFLLRERRARILARWSTVQALRVRWRPELVWLLQHDRLGRDGGRGDMAGGDAAGDGGAGEVLREIERGWMCG